MLYWIPALVWMGVIFYLSGRRGDELHSLFPFIDNFNPGHIAAYFVLALFYYLALQKNRHTRPYLKTFCLCLLYGITDEIHQYFIPTRYPDLFDLARDLLGTALALALVHFKKKGTH
ncbi:VanZ family protein [Desulfoscipio geothermicus]|uniref:VanZ like family protein n=1 Tax=Desulfoscipio geothermicus DSM 3669 TaxID=1121426 RepID=A0A1I6E6K0_9FIRM|nr:VanZ family protein [Desulfoscipio geothermicus]SFR13365.1 VanZ like family protein [Desulfoscipio geothermicus DSM 3669]